VNTAGGDSLFLFFFSRSFSSNSRWPSPRSSSFPASSTGNYYRAGTAFCAGPAPKPRPSDHIGRCWRSVVQGSRFDFSVVAVSSLDGPTNPHGTGKAARSARAGTFGSIYRGWRPRSVKLEIRSFDGPVGRVG